jgi:murein DD-endopeptidase MepM/ murein hydrolase activator NlpD
MKSPQGGLTIVLIPDKSGESRTIRLSPRVYRLCAVGSIFLAVFLGLVFLSWAFLLFRTADSWDQQARLDSLEAERAQVLSLAQELSRVEAEYEGIRALFGSGETPVASDLWLPPSGIPGSRSARPTTGEDEHIPTTWPLTEPGFITQSLVAQDSGDHPGLDIAVSTDSYIRAAGSGEVLRVGDDPLYGLFVVLEHGEGYQTVYAHASTVLVERGLTVRRGEVIALSGSTGQSTAPHLHFEILLEGVPVDPLSMVTQPG